MQLRPGRWRVLLTSLVLAGQFASMLAPAVVRSADANAPMSAKQARSSVETGVNDYSHARFDDAIAILRGLVDGGQLNGALLQRAREYLARSLAKRGLTQESDRVFKDILTADPSWRPDLTVVPPDESTVFDLALKEFQAAGGGQVTPADSSRTAPAPAATTPTPEQKAAQLGNPPPSSGGRKSSKKLWYIVGGAAVVGTVAAVAGGGGKSGSSAKPLPGFPGSP